METNVTSTEDVSLEDRTVWVANYAGHIYEKAERYGKVRKITVGYISFKSLDRIKFQIANELTQTQSEDYLLISGAAIICTIAAVIWLSMHGKVKLLYWDKSADNSEGAYRPMIITNTNLNELLHVLTSTGDGEVNESTEEHNKEMC